MSFEKERGICMKKILFMGDSITDAVRQRDNDCFAGNGYPTLVAARLGCDFPGEYVFLNRGISGNRVTDLLARIKVDMINLKPDVMSILIGVNDVWHEIGLCNGVHTELFETVYDLLIKELKAALPELRIMIMEPFVRPGSATEGQWDYFRDEVALRAAAAARVAEKNGLEFIPLQARLEEAEHLAPTSHWLMDGVHPTAAGHEIIARAWIETFVKH